MGDAPSEVLTDGRHLVCSDADRLHSFAASIGLRRRWFQAGRCPHYDLTTPRAVRRAIAAGARLMETRDLVRALKAREKT